MTSTILSYDLTQIIHYHVHGTDFDQADWDKITYTILK